jgi:hypothetical protein
MRSGGQAGVKPNLVRGCMTEGEVIILTRTAPDPDLEPA